MIGQKMAIIQFKNNGLTMERKICWNVKPPPIESRDREFSYMKKFSSPSRRRLRKKIMDIECPPGWNMFSVTLTVPGEVTDFWVYTSLWDRYRKNYLNGKPLICIWRKEVQQRGADHFHLIIFSDPQFDIEKIKLPWWRVIRYFESCRMDLIGAFERSVEIKPITDCAKWARYMQDHLSKRKKDQVSLYGRHWGVVNKKLITGQDDIDNFEIPDYIWFKFRRCMRRLFKPTIHKERKPFGRVLGYEVKNRGVWGRSDYFTETSKKESLKKYLMEIIK